jgi:hypothetical protein
MRRSSSLFVCEGHMVNGQPIRPNHVRVVQARGGGVTALSGGHSSPIRLPF